MAQQLSKHFFKREGDGTVRLRLRFSAEEASLFEEAAGENELIRWVHKTLVNDARRQVTRARATLPRIDAPRDHVD